MCLVLAEQKTQLQRTVVSYPHGFLHNLLLGIGRLPSEPPKAYPQREVLQLPRQAGDLPLDLLQCTPSLYWGAQNWVYVTLDAV